LKLLYDLQRLFECVDKVCTKLLKQVCHLGTQAMIGVTSCLAAEFARGVGLKEQVGEAPASILAVFVLISLASYVPIFRGYTRKEDFSNGPFTPKSENWNGRCAPHYSLRMKVVAHFRRSTALGVLKWVAVRKCLS
jgi:hypothetical protein